MDVKIAITSAPTTSGLMTLDDIEVFMKRARAIGIPGTSVVKSTTNMKRDVKRLEVTCDPDELGKDA